MSSRNHRAEIFADQMAAALSRPDPTVPYVFFEVYCENSPLQSERKLMIAVLEEATHCLRAKGLRDKKDKEEIKRLSQDAEKWFVDQRSDYIFSFENICQVLGINPAFTREMILRQRPKRPSRRVRSGQRLSIEHNP